MSNQSIIEEEDDISEKIDEHIIKIEQEINNNSHNKDINKNIHEYSIIEKKEIVNKIGTLSKIEHIEIFKILKKNNIKYTENSNGIFINFINVDNHIIESLDEFIKFCYKNKDSLVENENILNEKKNIIENKYYSTSSSNSDDEIQYDYEEESNNIDGSKINLKKNKPKFTGVKAKIMNNYKVGVKTNK